MNSQTLAHRALMLNLLYLCHQALSCYLPSHLHESLAFVKEYAQEMDEAVMQKHIHLYVNHYSLSLGEKGKAAIQQMCDFMEKNKLIKPSNTALFV